MMDNKPTIRFTQAAKKLLPPERLRKLYLASLAVASVGIMSWLGVQTHQMDKQLSEIEQRMANTADELSVIETSLDLAEPVTHKPKQDWNYNLLSHSENGQAIYLSQQTLDSFDPAVHTRLLDWMGGGHNLLISHHDVSNVKQTSQSLGEIDDLVTMMIQMGFPKQGTFIGHGVYTASVGLSYDESQVTYLPKNAARTQDICAVTMARDHHSKKFIAQMTWVEPDVIEHSAINSADMRNFALIRNSAICRIGASRGYDQITSYMDHRGTTNWWANSMAERVAITEMNSLIGPGALQDKQTPLHHLRMRAIKNILSPLYDKPSGDALALAMLPGKSLPSLPLSPADQEQVHMDALTAFYHTENALNEVYRTVMDIKSYSWKDVESYDLARMIPIAINRDIDFYGPNDRNKFLAEKWNQIAQPKILSTPLSDREKVEKFRSIDDQTRKMVDRWAGAFQMKELWLLGHQTSYNDPPPQGPDYWSAYEVDIFTTAVKRVLNDGIFAPASPEHKLLTLYMEGMAYFAPDLAQIRPKHTSAARLQPSS